VFLSEEFSGLWVVVPWSVGPQQLMMAVGDEVVGPRRPFFGVTPSSVTEEKIFRSKEVREMSKYTMHFNVAVPPAAVFTYLKDPKTTMPGLTKIEVIHEASEDVGTAYRYEERFLGMRFTGIFVITEHVPDKRLTIEFSGALEEGKATWTFEPSDEGTDVTIASDFRLRIPVLGGLAVRLMRRTNETRWLPALKEQIEKHARSVEPAA
jgi:carbon monoxide dehydrogenase subunit G